MDVDSESIVPKECYKCDQLLFDNLNINYNSFNSVVVLWNRYQIFIYENLVLDHAEKELIPEFQIRQLFITNNYLICLDDCDIIHVTSLKFKNTSQKKLKCSFQQREQDVKTCFLDKEDHLVSLKCEYNTYFLCVHKINSTFQLVRRAILISKSGEDLPRPNCHDNYLITCAKINKDNRHFLKNLNNSEDHSKDSDIVLISFDKRTIYCCLLDNKMNDDEINIVNLYTCPSEINNLQIINTDELYLYICLNIGTVLRLALNNKAKPPDTIHLNKALHKIVVTNHMFIYTDGLTMWKAVNLVKNLMFKKLFVKDVHDFIISNNVVICTTFAKLIYKFVLEDECFLKESNEEYTPVHKILTNAECLEQTFVQIEINDQLVKKLASVQNFILALSLSNRQDIMHKVIQSNITVYDSYQEVIRDKTNLILTESISEYFTSDTYIVLLQIEIFNMHQLINNILSNFANLDIHVILSSQNKILKTTSICMSKRKIYDLIIPLHMKHVSSKVNVSIKIICNMPGVFDDSKKIWTALYKKDIVLKSEQFLICNNKSSNMYLKEDKENIDNLISEICAKQYGNMFEIYNSSINSNIEWSLYAKLPIGYEEIFKNVDRCSKYLSKIKSEHLIKQLSSEDFKKAKCPMTLKTGERTVKIEIINDGFSDPVLRVVSESLEAAVDIRNFFSNILYGSYEYYEAGTEFISSSFYASTENLQRSVKNYITRPSDIHEILSLAEKFERNVVGALPV